MPYIPDERRPPIGAGGPTECGGDLNYRLYTLMLLYRKSVKEVRYQTYSEIGAAYRACERDFDLYLAGWPWRYLGWLPKRSGLHGELNKAIRSHLLRHPWRSRAKAVEDIHGTLKNCYPELYRKYIAPYEDYAITRPGHSDVVV